MTGTVDPLWVVGAGPAVKTRTQSGQTDRVRSERAETNIKHASYALRVYQYHLGPAWEDWSARYGGFRCEEAAAAEGCAACLLRIFQHARMLLIGTLALAAASQRHVHTPAVSQRHVHTPAASQPPRRGYYYSDEDGVRHYDDAHFPESEEDDGDGGIRGRYLYGASSHSHHPHHPHTPSPYNPPVPPTPPMPPLVPPTPPHPPPENRPWGGFGPASEVEFSGFLLGFLYFYVIPCYGFGALLILHGFIYALRAGTLGRKRHEGCADLLDECGCLIPTTIWFTMYAYIGFFFGIHSVCGGYMQCPISHYKHEAHQVLTTRFSWSTFGRSFLEYRDNPAGHGCTSDLDCFSMDNVRDDRPLLPAPDLGALSVAYMRSDENNCSAVALLVRSATRRASSAALMASASRAGKTPIACGTTTTGGAERMKPRG